MTIVTPKRFTITEYHRLIELGFLTEDNQVEEAQISDYCIINLLANQLERYSQPYQDAQGNFAYRFKQIALSNESVKLPDFPDLSLKLTQIFPGSG